MGDLHIPDALAEIWKLVGACNKYIDVTAPWSLAKSEAGQEYLVLLRDDGISMLSKDDRADEFDKLADQFLAGAATEIKAEMAEAIPAIKAAVRGVLTDSGFVSNYSAALKRSSMLFWMMAIMVGTCQGGIQALSRSFFGKLIPSERSNEYYGFFDIFGKFAAVMGPALYAFIKTLTGRSSYGILSLMILFAIGGTVLICGRKYFRELETRAKIN